MAAEDGAVETRLFAGSGAPGGPPSALGLRVGFLRRSSSSLFLLAPRPIPVEGECASISLRALGRSFRHFAYVVVLDYYGAARELPLGRLDFLGWKTLRAYVPPFGPRPGRPALRQAARPPRRRHPDRVRSRRGLRQFLRLLRRDQGGFAHRAKQLARAGAVRAGSPPRGAAASGTAAGDPRARRRCPRHASPCPHLRGHSRGPRLPASREAAGRGREPRRGLRSDRGRRPRLGLGRGDLGQRHPRSRGARAPTERLPRGERRGDRSLPSPPHNLSPLGRPLTRRS
jgi:hypothetical protein